MQLPTLPQAFAQHRSHAARVWLATLVCVVGLFSRPIDSAEILQPQFPSKTTDISFHNEVEHAIERGLLVLQSQQNSSGWWSTPEQPAVTALALTAFKGDPRQRFATNEPAWLQRGYAFLLANARADGGIHSSNLVTYNTAISMVALLAANRPASDAMIRRARNFLVRLQTDFGEMGKADNVFDGGIGYGSKYQHSDMGNTLAALEALHLSRHLVDDKSLAETKDLNWAAAISFLQNCQNLPAYNKQPWASGDATNKGGFVYYPGHSMAGGETNPVTGRVALRSYGSISYGGMLSYLYANLKRDDPRVTAVFDWLRANYTLDENPGLGPQGLYFYLQTMTKALTAYGLDELELRNGQRLDWRREVAMKLLNLQRADGSWSNDNARWWEKDTSLTTSYAVLSLEMIYRKL